MPNENEMTASQRLENADQLKRRAEMNEKVREIEALLKIEQERVKPGPGITVTEEEAKALGFCINVDAEIIKLRWTLVTLTKDIDRLRGKVKPEHIAHITLALRHLEDAESRLNRIVNL